MPLVCVLDGIQFDRIPSFISVADTRLVWWREAIYELQHPRIQIAFPILDASDVARLHWPYFCFQGSRKSFGPVTGPAISILECLRSPAFSRSLNFRQLPLTDRSSDGSHLFNSLVPSKYLLCEISVSYTLSYRSENADTIRKYETLTEHFNPSDFAMARQ